MKVELREGRERADDLSQLHERVLGTLLTWFAAGCALSMALLLVQSRLGGYLVDSMVYGTALSLLLVLLACIRRFVATRARAIGLVVVAAVVSLSLQILAGRPTPGTALMTVVLVLSGALFFGRRGVLYTSLTAMFALFVTHVAVDRGVIVPWSAELWNPQHPLVWARYALALLCVVSGLGTTFGYVIETLVESTAKLRETLERERAERSQRESVQLALERSRRLEALAQFAGGMAHDFNNNLAMIMGKAQMVVRDPGSPRQVAKLGADIVQSAESAAETVRHLLALGRADANDTQTVALGGVIRRSLPVLRQVLSPAVEVTLVGQTEQLVRADVARLQQALLNLALNARDAMADGGSFTLEVSERTLDEVPAGWLATPGRYVAIACRDSGTGIDPAIQARVFDPFFTTKEPGRGTGLGLATVRALVYEAHGFVELESALGGGTTIRLHLPLVERAPAREEVVVSEPKPAGTTLALTPG